MIQANELQLGNYFKDKDGIILTVRGMTPEDDTINSIIWYDNELGFYLTADECEPIPLTEDILIRCGFEKKRNHYDMGKLSIVMPTTEYPKGRTYYDSWAIKEGIPEYLHTLQNLVKLLCNQTIELK